MSASDLARAVLVAVLVSGCAREVSVPDPPDMTPLVASYREPDGTFSADDPGPVLDDASAQLAVLGGMDMSTFLTAMMTSIAQRLDGTGLGKSGDRAPTRVDAVLSLELACGDASGSIEVTTVLENSQLSHVLWGKATRCRVASVALDGSVAIYRYGAVDLGFSEASFLVRVDGTVTAGKKHRAAFDFRVTAGAVQTRIPTASGDVIVERHGTDLLVRAANGSFTCSLLRRTCRPSA